MLVHRRLVTAALAAGRQIAEEAGALFARIGELVKAVGELDAVQIKLEACRHAAVIPVSGAPAKPATRDSRR